MRQLLFFLCLILGSCDSSRSSTGFEVSQSRALEGESAPASVRSVDSAEAGRLQAPSRIAEGGSRAAVNVEASPVLDRTPGVLRGRVQDVGGGPLPEAGVRVIYLAPRSSLVAERNGSTTDEEGRFEIELGDWGPGAWVKLDPPEGWFAVQPRPSRLENMDPALWNGEEELLLLVARYEPTQVRLLAVNSDDGEPLPFLRFWISPAGRRRAHERFDPLEVVTDEEGYFESDLEFTSGRVNIEVASGDPRPVAYRMNLLGGEAQEIQRIAFRAGAVQEIELSGYVPDDSTDLYVWTWAEGCENPSPRAALRDGIAGGPPWVRLGVVAGVKISDQFLAVGDEAGLLFGVCERRIDLSVRHSDGDRLQVHMERTAAVSLDYKVPMGEATITIDGEPVTVDLPLMWSPGHQQLFGQTAWPSVHIKADGVGSGDPSLLWRAHKRRGLQPGIYTIIVESRDYETVTGHHHLEAGQVTPVPVFLIRKEGLRTLHGRIESADGTPPPGLSLRLWARSKPWENWRAEYKLRHEGRGKWGTGQAIRAEDGATLVTFDIESVSPHDLQVAVECDSGPCTTSLVEQQDGSVNLEVIFQGRESGR